MSLKDKKQNAIDLEAKITPQELIDQYTAEIEIANQTIHDTNATIQQMQVETNKLFQEQYAIIATAQSTIINRQGGIDALKRLLPDDGE